MSAGSRWSDLGPRVTSALVMAGAGAVMLLLGGWIMALGVAAIAGTILWEAARMLYVPAREARRNAILAAVALAALYFLGGYFLLPVIGATVLVVCQDKKDYQGLMALSYTGVMFAAYAFMMVRTGLGLEWCLWLVLVVVASDVGGYFAGKSLGGPKFWPAVSPKKTWSGTIAGWIGAAIVGGVFASWLGAGSALILVSACVAFAGQMGDIAESALKRRMEVKDSSRLIPGHGGVWDRFDGMLGAAALVWVFWVTGLLPGAS